MRARAGRNPTLTLIAFLLLFVIAWVTYHNLTKPGLDRYGDMVEAYAWGQEWQWGYYKHPPVFAWLAAAWFKIFPRTEWFYSLLSFTNVAAGLVAIFLIARFVFPIRTATVAIVLFAFMPTFTFLANKYNANSALLLWWPLTALFFVCGLKGRHWLFGVLFGLSAALAVLSKYYSAVLLAALFLCSLSSARRYFRSAHPYLALATFAALMAPHVRWLFEAGFPTVDYVGEQSADNWGWVLYRALVYFPLSQVGYLLVPTLVLWGLLRPDWARVRTNAAAISRDHSWLWWLNLGPLLIAVAAAVATKTEFSSVWGIPNGFAFTILLLCLFRGSDADPRWQELPQRGYRAAVGFLLFIVLIAPAVGWLSAQHVKRGAARPYAKIDAWLAREWSREVDRPLQFTGGRVVANGLAFYTDQHRRAVHFPLERSPWVDLETLASHGLVVVCEPDDEQCIRQFQESLPFEPDRIVDFAIEPDRFWGFEMPVFEGRAWFYYPRE